MKGESKLFLAAYLPLCVIMLAIGVLTNLAMREVYLLTVVGPFQIVNAIFGLLLSVFYVYRYERVNVDITAKLCFGSVVGFNIGSALAAVGYAMTLWDYPSLIGLLVAASVLQTLMFILAVSFIAKVHKSSVFAAVAPVQRPLEVVAQQPGDDEEEDLLPPPPAYEDGPESEPSKKA